MENNNEFSDFNGQQVKRVINQHEAIEMIARGSSLEDHTVVNSKQVNINWKGQDGKTLLDCIKADKSADGFLILLKHMELDLMTCVAYMGFHWSLWRNNVDKLTKR